MRSTGGPARRGALVLAAMALAALPACGQGGDSVGTGATTPPSSGSAGARPGSGTGEVPGRGGELTISVSDGSGATSTWTLTCGADGSSGGDHPDPAGACAALAALEEPFAPVPRDMMCTQVYGGPETATVRGTWNGSDVVATFKRTDGCEIARWKRVAPLLQPGAAGSAGGS